MTINTCIIPAAGKGSRWAPVSGYLPKEMLPLIDKPVIEWVINDQIAAGCKQIIVVINKHKETIKTYLENNSTINKRVSLKFVYQDDLFGISHALFLCKGLVKNESFGVALPDLPTISKQPILKQLAKTLNKKNNSHIVSFDKFSTETANLYGECLLKKGKENFLEIEHFCPKLVGATDKSHHYRNNIRMSGHFIFSPAIFPIIERLLKKRKEGPEVSDRTSLKSAMEDGQKVLGIKIVGHTYDTGYPTGYVRANTAFFKRYSLSKK